VNDQSLQKVSPEERFQNAFAKFFLNVNNLSTFYLTTTDLLRVGKDHVEQKLLQTGKGELEKPEIKQLIGDNPFFQNELITSFILRATAKRSVRISNQVIGSSTLVFAHAILDGILSECCHISFGLSPSDWFPFVDEQKLKVKDLVNAEKVIHQKAYDFVCQLDRESIARKLDLLHKVCAPKWKGEKLITEWVKTKQIDDFDEIRIRAIHQQAFAQKISEVEEQVLFATLVGISALVLVGKAYGLLEKDKFDVKKILAKAFIEAQSDFPEILELFKGLTK
jgi:hypothetical protein